MCINKMSSQGDDIDVNVVSSPEPSPQGSTEHSRDRTSDDERLDHYHHHHHHLLRHQQSAAQNHHHHNNNNNNNNYQQSADSSPSKTPPNTNTAGSGGSNNKGFTSFSISSILSRNDTATTGNGIKKVVNSISAIAPTTAPTIGGAVGAGNIHGPQDAAMLSR